MGKRTLIVVAAIAAIVLVAVPGALAKSGGDDRVIKTGNCSGAANWKLKVKPDDGRLEVEFEVDQNRVGKRWHVVLRHNGNVFFDGFRRTTAPSGSFTIERRVNNAAGADTIRAKATRPATGQTCLGSATI